MPILRWKIQPLMNLTSCRKSGCSKCIEATTAKLADTALTTFSPNANGVGAECRATLIVIQGEIKPESVCVFLPINDCAHRPREDAHAVGVGAKRRSRGPVRQTG